MIGFWDGLPFWLIDGIWIKLELRFILFVDLFLVTLNLALCIDIIDILEFNFCNVNFRFIYSFNLLSIFMKIYDF